jgi:hypothetical protein
MHTRHSTTALQIYPCLCQLCFHVTCCVFVAALFSMCPCPRLALVTGAAHLSLPPPFALVGSRVEVMHMPALGSEA